MRASTVRISMPTGDADVDIDYEDLVQDGVDDISEAAGRGAVEIPVGRAGRDGHESIPRVR
jgi:hypothetical protein